jgi:hypothetical protein
MIFWMDIEPQIYYTFPNEIFSGIFEEVQPGNVDIEKPAILRISDGDGDRREFEDVPEFEFAILQEQLGLFSYGNILYDAGQTVCAAVHVQLEGTKNPDPSRLPMGIDNLAFESIVFVLFVGLPY